MNLNTSQADLLIRTAYQALQSGDRKAALQAARQAVLLAPQREEPWLILAVVAEPRASLAYIQQALKINPASSRAKEGLRWAKARLNEPSSSEPCSTPLPFATPSSRSEVLPPLSGGEGGIPKHPSNRATHTFTIVFLVAFLGLLLLIGTLAGWRAIAGSNQASLATVQLAGASPSSPTTQPAEQAVLPPAAADTPQPGNDPEPIPVALSDSKEATPLATPTKLPSSPTPNSGVTPTGQTYLVQPGDSLPQIASRFKMEPLALMQANHIANPLAIEPGQILVIPASRTIRKVTVDISDQRLYAYEGDRLAYTFVVSTGQSDGTLRGNFSILDKVENPYSEMWGFWMPNWLGIYQAMETVENGIHALPVSKNGQRLGADLLGQPVSSGCVILSPEDAQLLYDWVDVGTPVLIRD